MLNYSTSIKPLSTAFYIGRHRSHRSEIDLADAFGYHLKSAARRGVLLVVNVVNRYFLPRLILYYYSSSWMYLIPFRLNNSA